MRLQCHVLNHQIKVPQVRLLLCLGSSAAPLSSLLPHLLAPTPSPSSPKCRKFLYLLMGHWSIDAGSTHWNSLPCPLCLTRCQILLILTTQYLSPMFSYFPPPPSPQALKAHNLDHLCGLLLFPAHHLPSQLVSPTHSF